MTPRKNESPRGQRGPGKGKAEVEAIVPPAVDSAQAPSVNQPPSLQDVLATLSQGRTFHIRCFPRQGMGVVLSGNYDSVEAAVADVEWVDQREESKGCYTLMNELAEGLPVTNKLAGGKAVKATDVTRVWHLPLDFDAPRDNSSRCMATDEELDKAVNNAARVMTFLEDLGWEPVVASHTGNGVQAIYCVDLEPTEATRLFDSLFTALNLKFDSDTVDTNLQDASRIFRLPGTWNRKGENTPERPWRRGEVMGVLNPKAGVVTVEQIQAAIEACGGTVPSRGNGNGDGPRGEEEARLPKTRRDDSPLVEGSADVIVKLMVPLWGNRRNEAAKALTGHLYVEGVPAGEVVAVEKRIMSEAKDEELEDRLTDAIYRTIRMVDNGESVLGAKGVVELWGQEVKDALDAELKKRDRPPVPKPSPDSLSARFDLELCPELSDDETVQDPLIEGVQDRGTDGYLFGPTNTGKSFVAISRGVAIAAGLDWCGRECAMGTVFYVALEGTKHNLKRRLTAALRARGLSGKRVPFIFSFSRVQFGGAPPEALKALAEDINRAVDDNGLPPVVLVIVDTYSRAIGGDENKTEAATAYANDLTRFCELLARGGDRPATYSLRHPGHTNKNRPKGAYSATAGVDMEEQLSAGPPLKNSDGYRAVPLTLSTTKDRDGDSRGQQITLTLRQVPVILPGGKTLQRHGVVSTTCVIESAEGVSPQDRVVAFVREHPGCSATQVRKGVVGKNTRTAEIMDRLLARGVLSKDAKGGWFVGQPPSPSPTPPSTPADSSRSQASKRSTPSGPLPSREGEREPLGSGGARAVPTTDFNKEPHHTEAVDKGQKWFPGVGTIHAESVESHETAAQPVPGGGNRLEVPKPPKSTTANAAPSPGPRAPKE